MFIYGVVALGGSFALWLSFSSAFCFSSFSSFFFLFFFLSLDLSLGIYVSGRH